ncbi:8423_t:CDS:1, partial [Paraglomus brasilianum]
ASSYFMTTEPPPRPSFNSYDTPPPFNPSPALAAMDIKDRCYQGFARQIIILNIPVDSIQSVQRLWLKELKKLGSIKEIHVLYT